VRLGPTLLWEAVLHREHGSQCIVREKLSHESGLGCFS
jgi:hypothetical protein